MKKTKHTIYCYADETGQDTEGRLFAVSVLVTESEQSNLLKKLEAIERRSGKGVIKWKKSRPKSRKAYIQGVAQLKPLEGSLFVTIYRDSKDYLEHTADAIAKALRQRPGDRAIIYVDALSDAEQQRLKRQLRPSVKIPTQVRGVRKEENNTFIRLVDAVCGLVRDAEEGDKWAQVMVKLLKRKGILKAL